MLETPEIHRRISLFGDSAERAALQWFERSNLATPDRRHGDAPNIASFHEALFGSWEYRDDQHSLGWDPSTVLMGAFTPKAPTAMNKAGVKAAVWLALESLPFFPCFYDGGLATSGFEKKGRREVFRWPIWETALTAAAVRVLIQHTIALKEAEWSHRGVVALYASGVFKPNEYLTSFRFKSYIRISLRFRSLGVFSGSSTSRGSVPSFRTVTAPRLAVSRMFGPSPTVPFSVEVRPSRS